MVCGMTPKIRAALHVMQAYYPGVTYEDVAGYSRKRDITPPRHFLCALLRELGFSYPWIGEKLNRNHASIIYGQRRALEDWGEALFSELACRLRGEVFISCSGYTARLVPAQFLETMAAAPKPVDRLKSLPREAQAGAA